MPSGLWNHLKRRQSGAWGALGPWDANAHTQRLCYGAAQPTHPGGSPSTLGQLGRLLPSHSTRTQSIHSLASPSSHMTLQLPSPAGPGMAGIEGRPSGPKLIPGANSLTMSSGGWPHSWEQTGGGGKGCCDERLYSAWGHVPAATVTLGRPACSVPASGGRLGKGLSPSMPCVSLPSPAPPAATHPTPPVPLHPSPHNPPSLTCISCSIPMMAGKSPSSSSYCRHMRRMHSS